MRSRRYIAVLLTLLALTLVGCRPKGILHSWEMRDLLVDLHKTDALLQTKCPTCSNETKAIYYAQVLAAHGVTQAQFDSCLAWYTAHPQLFDKIYPKVLKELDKEREAFLALHPEYAEVAFTDEGLQVTGDSLPVFTRREMDSILWVAAHGYVNSWNPLTLPPDTSVHDFIDEFFPQLRISSSGVVDTLETGVGVSEVAHD